MSGRTKVEAAPNSHSITITREFDAPRDLVFNAMVDPALIAQWWGPRGYENKIEALEPKSGGNWRFIQTNPDGMEFPFHGVFHDVSRPERIIQTFEFEGLPEPGHVSLQSMQLDALPEDRTKMTSRVVFLTVEDRDGMIQSGMEGGMSEGFERLDEVLATEA